MQLSHDHIELRANEETLFIPWLDRVGGRILELGCGAAHNTRRIAEHPRVESVLALETDATQHRKNLDAPAMERLRFEAGAAQAIPATDASFDMVFMFKSLHHVPAPALDQALHEIHRVLAPGGIAYVSEPIFAGPFNEVLAMFHDESAVRLLAFEALVRAVQSGLFELVEERFFLQPVVFQDFACFERQVIGVTHTVHRLDPERLEQVRQSFERQLAVTKGEFWTPQRVDVLRAREVV